MSWEELGLGLSPYQKLMIGGGFEVPAHSGHTVTASPRTSFHFLSYFPLHVRSLLAHDTLPRDLTV